MTSHVSIWCPLAYRCSSFCHRGFLQTSSTHWPGKMAMESVLKCLIRDSQALGRGYMHIQQAAQVALGLCCMLLLLVITYFHTSMLWSYRGSGITNGSTPEPSIRPTRKDAGSPECGRHLELRALASPWINWSSGMLMHETMIFL